MINRLITASTVFVALVLLAPGHAGAQSADQQLRIIAPAAPGGGWDQTARVIQQVIQRTGVFRTASVDNVPGAAGTIGLARFISAERGRGDVVMVAGLIMLGGIVTHGTPVTLHDVTPIARLVGEYEVLVVPRASPIRSLSDFITAFRQRPESISWGGGSAGGSDQMLAGLIAEAVGVAPRRVNYIAFSGGGEAMSAILGGQVSVGINGLAEFEAQIKAGSVRALAISSSERVPGLDIPTFREQGVAVELENWRSLVAAPGITDRDLERLKAAIEAMVRSPEWRDILARYRWMDRYLAGDEFTRFSAAEETRVRSILGKLGLTPAASTSFAVAGVYSALVLLGLGVLAIAVVLDSARVPGDRKAEDRTAGWRPSTLIAIGVAADVMLMEPAGFVAASAVLFWLTARAFDEEHPIRDALFAFAVSMGAYLLFARVLKVTLPAGLTGRWL